MRVGNDSMKLVLERDASLPYTASSFRLLRIPSYGTRTFSAVIRNTESEKLGIRMVYLKTREVLFRPYPQIKEKMGEVCC